MSEREPAGAAVADTSSAALRLSGITKTFGASVAVRDLNLIVPTGALYGVIGPNGAGKTTTIRLIMSIFTGKAAKRSFNVF